MSQKMQTLLDYIVNEEMDKANELFHEIVVEKSREIYENLIAEEAEEDESVEEADEEEDESVEEADEEEDESVEEGFGNDETSTEIGGDEADPADALVHGTEMGGDDMGGDEMGGDMSAPADKADIQDLEDALAELKAEFEALMSDASDDGEINGSADDDTAAEPEFGDDDEEDADDEESDDEESDDDESMGLREYRETVGNDWHKNSMKTAGPVGSGKGELAGQTSVNDGAGPVSSGKGKPTTGATAHNILGKSSTSNEDGTAPKGKVGGLVKTGGKFTGGSTHNVDGVKSGVKTLGKVAGGHGAEKKGAGPGPVGAGTGDKAGQTSVGQVKSPLNGAPNRNA